uniref:Insulin-like growth factor-binding protein 3 n=1 Tax=Periophthalmus magnuspinnatus TaxID=409849 RepID=A0A3B3ZAG0_9GOBI
MILMHCKELCVTFFLYEKSSAVGPVIRCEPCDAAARLLCKPLPKDCAERVREPGCGCCLTCALSFGQPCGVYSGKCGTGMSCQPQPGETKPLQALLEGRGICANATSKRISVRPTAPVNELPEPVETQEEDRNTTGLGLQTTSSTHRPLAPMGPQLHPFFSSAKSEMLRQEQHKRTQSFKLEVGPCRREIESILSSLKITDNLNPRGFRIPNCDKKGFYKRKQCRPSKGRKRGLCWAVDKYGQPVPGDAQYYNSESQ